MWLNNALRTLTGFPKAIRLDASATMLTDTYVPQFVQFSRLSFRILNLLLPVMFGLRLSVPHLWTDDITCALHIQG